MEIKLKTLNPQQKQAVTHDGGPLLIVAGAGTGKTTVITQRIAWLIEENKAKSDEILALTFTDKAAGEMEERIDQLLPYGYVDLWISTFHAFAEKILKAHALEIGLPNDFKLLNQTQQWMLVRQNLDKFNLDYYRPLGNPTKFIHALIKLFSRAKDEVVTPKDYLNYTKDLELNIDSADFVKNILDAQTIKMLSKKEKKEFVAQEIKKAKEVAEAFHVYQQLLLQNNALDFGDLINYCLKLFKDRPAVLAKYRQQFKYILVDEFQDTNYAQYELVKLLASPQNNVTVVGDDDQCLPPESLVETNKGKKKIKDIKVGDQVVTAVGRGYLSYRLVTKVFENKKKAKFITFKTANGYRIKVTDNHKMFCFVPAIDDKKYYYVYLMHRKNLGWRMGVTNDLALRLRLERSADRILGIKTCLSETEARFYETIYSLKYNIPTVCFQERKGLAVKGEWLSKLYQEINTEENASRLAKDLNLDLASHHYSLGAVNRGKQLRIKINLEMCHRRYRSKFAKSSHLINPKVIHYLSLETSDLVTIRKLKRAGFKFKPAKKGYRLRLYGTDLKELGDLALKLERITGGILEVSAKLGKENIQTRKTLVMPAKNIMLGQYLPVLTKNGVIYDRIVDKNEEEKRTVIVYDLEVENTHNFVADGIVVHNSIYKFRGASVSNILEFKHDYPKSAEIFLNKNYRSTQDILDLSYKFIQQNNPDRLEVKLASRQAGKLSKKLVAQNKDKGLISHLAFNTIDDEVRGVLKQVVDLKEKDKSAGWSDFAILSRTNEVANYFVNAIAQTQIPYQFVASRGLYSKPVILDILAYLKLLDNYRESAAMYRVLGFSVFGLGFADINTLNYWANRKGISLYQSLKQAAALPNTEEETRGKLKNILLHLENHSRLIQEKTVGEIVIAFLEDTGYLQDLVKKDDLAAQQAVSYLNQFYKKISEFENSTSDQSVKGFLDLIELELEAGEAGSLTNNLDEGPDSVKIMTVHAAKGLEFKYVFIVNLVDRRFPIDDRRDPLELPEKLIKEILPQGDAHLQEERRLFYVAMTRAKQGLFFTSAADCGGARRKKISRFLAELKEIGLKIASDSKASKGGGLLEQRTQKIRVEIGTGELENIVPTRFSFTQLRAFESCPYQYRFAHILRVPVRGKAQFSFGKTIHATLQQFFDLVRQRSNVQQVDLFGQAAQSSELRAQGPKVSLDELLAIYENTWIDDWYVSRKEHDEYKQKGRKALTEFYKKIEKDIPIPKYLERPFNLKLECEDEEYTIKGVIDRIDALDGGIEIIDYKTGAGRTKENFTAEDKEQLLIYQLAAEQVLSEKVEKLSFYYVETGNVVSFLGSQKELGSIKKKMICTINEIKKGQFPPKPGMMCGWCDFKNICEFRAL
ncbi:MAG: UvrD-helicase domain-containing protein [Patescibacteria group bacterium]|jgi:DNA helicase-2/ATP-dependent DNA helicase PcrA